MVPRHAYAILVAVILSWPPWIQASRDVPDVFLQRVYGVAEETVGIAAGDFDRDGKPDLVTASYARPYLSLLFGNDSGAFEPQVRLAGAAVEADVLVADFDGDENDDIVTRSREGVNVWLGNGDRTFAQMTAPLCPFPAHC